jgi:hypothetical protein
MPCAGAGFGSDAMAVEARFTRDGKDVGGKRLQSGQAGEDRESAGKQAMG